MELPILKIESIFILIKKNKKLGDTLTMPLENLRDRKVGIWLLLVDGPTHKRHIINYRGTTYLKDRKHLYIRKNKKLV